MGPPFASPILSSPVRGHQRTSSYRELRSQPGNFHHAPQIGYAVTQSYDPGAFRPPPPHLEIPTIPPIAVLSIDLVVAKANQAFHEALAPGVNLRGTRLLDLVSPSHGAEIQGLQSQLRSERDTKDPTYLPPIHGSAHDLDAISSIDDRNLLTATQGTMERKFYWTFRTTSGQQRNFHLTAKLARTSVFFVVLMLLPSSQYSAPSPSPYAMEEAQRGLHSSPISSTLARSPVLGQVGQHRPFSSGSSQSGSPYYTSPGPTLSPETRLLANIPRSSHHEEPRATQTYYQTHPGPSVTSAPASHTGRSPPISSSEVASYPRSRSGDLRHLELPPIHSPATSREVGPAHRRSHSEHDVPDPAGDDSQLSGGRKRKRQRLGIEDMLR